MKETMLVVVIEPGKPAQVKNFKSDLDAMQKIVGGYIEIVPAEWLPNGGRLLGKNLLLVVNEEGKLKNLPPNFPIRNGSDYIFGPAFVCKSQEDEMVGLSEEEATLVAGLVHRKEEING